MQADEAQQHPGAAEQAQREQRLGLAGPELQGVGQGQQGEARQEQVGGLALGPRQGQQVDQVRQAVEQADERIVAQP